MLSNMTRPAAKRPVSPPQGGEERSPTALPKRLRRERLGAPPTQDATTAVLRPRGAIGPLAAMPSASAKDLFLRGDAHIERGAWQDAETYWHIARGELGRSSIEFALLDRAGPWNRGLAHRAVLLYHAAIGPLEDGTLASCQLACFRLRASQALFPPFFPALLALGVGEVLLGYRQAGKDALARGAAGYVKRAKPAAGLEALARSNDLGALLALVNRLRQGWYPARLAAARAAIEVGRAHEGRLALDAARMSRRREERDHSPELEQGLRARLPGLEADRRPAGGPSHGERSSSRDVAHGPFDALVPPCVGLERPSRRAYLVPV
jgi:hypothetical protein